jgi:hypothetical protein
MCKHLLQCSMNRLVVGVVVIIVKIVSPIRRNCDPPDVSFVGRGITPTILVPNGFEDMQSTVSQNAVAECRECVAYAAERMHSGKGSVYANTSCCSDRWLRGFAPTLLVTN